MTTYAQTPKSEDALLSSLPRNVQRQLLACPPEGGGVHRWLFLTAKMLHGCGLSPDEIETLLEEHADRADAREIADAIRNSDPEGQAHLEYLNQKPGGELPSKWPSRDESLILRLVESGPVLAELAEMSKVPLSGAPPTATQVIDWLFPGDPLLCCATDGHMSVTRLKSEWSSQFETLPFIVPSPMTSRRGKTLSGRPSARSKENTGPRRYLVIEFDFKKPELDGPRGEREFYAELLAGGRTVKDVCAALLWELRKNLRLDTVVFSGGKSLHGWFYCDGFEDDQLRPFMRHAVMLGADAATWTRSQLVRIPQGLSI